MGSFLRNITLAFEGVARNKLRAFLTALGIIFGVAAVIAMMAIGRGAQQAIIAQLEEIGTNNIFIAALSVEEQEEEKENNVDAEEKKKYSPGLGMEDVLALKNLLPSLRNISPEIAIKKQFTSSAASGTGTCQGVWNDYFKIFNLTINEGNFFSNYHQSVGSPVCIIGSAVKRKYFQNKSPIGSKIKCGRQWFSVIGVLDKKDISSDNSKSLGNFNDYIYIPAKTAIQRLENRSRIDKSDVASRGRRGGKTKNYHQLDRVLLKVDDNDELRSTASVAKRALLRRHNDVEDVSFDIPELLIKQRQSTQQTLNFVLAIIAGISLLVGGIGIMNIMLASVLERIKEIGIRRSVGADQRDIAMQFLLEATVISLLGGLIGIVVGIVAAEIIAGYSEITTALDLVSIVLSFGVAVSVGLIFGYLPARKAAQQDPVKALRSD